jgi:hypothetical protein
LSSNKPTAPTEEAAVAGLGSIPIDNNRPTVVVAIFVVIVIFLDNDGLIAIPVIAVTDDVTILVTIAVVARTHRDANRPDADSDFFRSGRYRGTNSGHRNGHYRQTPHHRCS